MSPHRPRSRLRGPTHRPIPALDSVAMICDCCDRDSPWARTSPDDVGWCGSCRTYQWRRDAQLHSYLEGSSKAEGGHGCIRCDEPWGIVLRWVWHASCRCRIKGPLPNHPHRLVSLTPGKVAHVACECGWTGIGTYDQYDDEEDLGDDFQKDRAADAARDAHDEHRYRESKRACHCLCHARPACLPIHAERRDQMPLHRFACKRLT
jgi:hypothetical protein